MGQKILIAPEADFEASAGAYHLQTLENAVLHDIGDRFDIPGGWRPILASTTADVFTIAPEPSPEWILSGGDGSFTIIESPEIAPPVVVGGDGKFTITG